jgi:hypothetical protein
MMPEEHFERRRITLQPSLRSSVGRLNTAILLSGVSGPTRERPYKLSELVATGVLTAPLADMDGILYVLTSGEMSADGRDPLPREVSGFSRSDKQVWIVSGWRKRGKVSKGLFSAAVYDVNNQTRVTVTPKKMSLQSAALRLNMVVIRRP